MSNDAIAGAAAKGRPRAQLWRGPRFIAEIFDGADEALAALEAVQTGLLSTPFQSLNWLTLLYEDLAPAKRAMPRVVVVTERNSGDVALVLPLLVTKKRRLKVARFADLGIAACGAPILGPVALTKPRSIRRAWRAIRYALRDIDLIRLERMPDVIGGRPNPLLSRAGIAPARYSGNILSPGSSFDDYMKSRGAAYRDDVTECRSALERVGRVRFFRAEEPAEIARVFSALDEQWLECYEGPASRSAAQNPAERTFYERLAMDGTEAGFAYLFALESDGEIIAALLGVRHDDTFALLRLTTARDGWTRATPGRLLILEIVRYFAGRGVRHFDFGLRDKGFKRSFGAVEIVLRDLIVAREIAALPRATFHRLKGRLRRNRQLRSMTRRLRAVFGH